MLPILLWRTWALFYAVEIVHSFDLSEFESASSACASDFSCEAAAVSNDESSLKCRCDINCVDYGECCYDAPAHDIYKQIYNLKRQQCIHRTNMIVKCPKEWENPDIASLCSEHSPLDISRSREPILHVPVISENSNFTYANYYCAICNDDAESITMWEPEMQCFFRGNMTRDDNLNLLMDYFDLRQSNAVDRYKFKEFTNASNLEPELLKDERVIEFIKANLFFSDEEETWLISVPTSEPLTMECAFQLSYEKDKTPHQCTPSIHTCASNWTDKETENLCQSFAAQIEYFDTYKVIERSSKIYAVSGSEPISYRNIYCAKCNHKSLESPCMSFMQLPSLNPKSRSSGVPPIPPFSILLQTPAVGQRHKADDENKCNNSEEYIPFYSSCNSMLCLITNERYRKGLCITKRRVHNGDGQRETVSKQGSENEVTVTHIEAENMKNSSNKYTLVTNKEKNESDRRSDHMHSSNHTVISFLYKVCQKNLIRKEDFLRSTNGIVIKDSQRTYDFGTYEETDEGILVCSSDPMYFYALGWMTFVGLVISIVCISLHLLAFLLVKELRNLPGKNLAALCLCLQVGYISFITGSNFKPQTMSCYVAASSIYFCFFASWCWMTVIAFDIWISFKRATISFYRRTESHWGTYLAYSLYSWALSITALASMVTIDQLKPSTIPANLLPDLGVQSCWFGQNASLILFFVGPMIISNLLTVSFFVMTAMLILKVNSETESAVGRFRKRNLFVAHVRLAVLMGVTWVSGTSAWFTQHIVSWIVFTIFNTLQGAFIFWAFTCQKKVWQKITSMCPGKTTKNKAEGNQTGSTSPDQKRIELLHVSRFLDRLHQPSRVHGGFISTST